MQDTGLPNSLIKYTCSSWGSHCFNVGCSHRGCILNSHHIVYILQYGLDYQLFFAKNYCRSAIWGENFETVKKLGYFFLCQNHFFKVWTASVVSESHISKPCKPHMPIIHYTKIRTVLQSTCTHKWWLDTVSYMRNMIFRSVMVTQAARKK